MLIVPLSLHNVTARSVANAMVVKMVSLILMTGAAERNSKTWQHCQYPHDAKTQGQN
jgi:hypothetical protein